MIYYDKFRVTAKSYYELRNFCDRNNINPSGIVSEGGIVFVHLNTYGQKIADRSSGVKHVTASEFNTFGLKLGTLDLKDAGIAYEEHKSSKKGLEHEIHIKNGKKFEKVWSGTATGELDLFKQIANERCSADGILRSEISGAPLIQDPNHYLYVNQFMHILPKSLYGKFRLRKDNIVLGTYEEHNQQTRNPGKCKLDKNWAAFYKKEAELKQEYHAKG